MTDVHDIPIPYDIGPIVGVVVDSHSGRKWNLDRIVVDGRSFHFEQADTDYARRFATHFVFVRVRVSRG